MPTPAPMSSRQLRQQIETAALSQICEALFYLSNTCQVKTDSVARVTCSTTQKTTYCNANDYFPLFVPKQIIHKTRSPNADLLNKCVVTSISYQQCPDYVEDQYTAPLKSAVTMIVNTCVEQARIRCTGESQVFTYDGTIFPAVVDRNSDMTHPIEK